MKFLGVDFTSTPTRTKPIACLYCMLVEGTLRTDRLVPLVTFEDFEETLRAPGPWIAGADFPFGQSRKFIENIGWPVTWVGYVAHAQRLGRHGFCDALNAYRASRPMATKSTSARRTRPPGQLAHRSSTACRSR